MTTYLLFDVGRERHDVAGQDRPGARIARIAVVPTASPAPAFTR